MPRPKKSPPTPAVRPTLRRSRPVTLAPAAPAPEPASDPISDNPAPHLESAAPGGAVLAADTSHFDGIVIADDPGVAVAATAEEVDPARAAVTGADELMAKDPWVEMVAAYIAMTGHLTQLQTLVSAPAAGTYPDAAAAMYDTIRAVPALHWMLGSGGVWGQRIGCIVAWAVPVASGVKSEIAARRAARRAGPSRDQAAAPDPAVAARAAASGDPLAAMVAGGAM